MNNIILQNGSNITPKAIEWLWYPYIPKNKVCLLAGFQGEGKSTMAVDIMAAVTTARTLPACPHNMMESENPLVMSPVAGNVLYINPEDGLEDTIIPRLIKSGADMSRCLFLPNDVVLGNLNMKDYIKLLRDVVSQPSNMIKLVVIDPLNSNLASDVSSKGGDRLNKLLTEISRIANDYDCAFVLITHLAKKAREKDEIDMGDVLGATGIMGTVRIGLLVEEFSRGTVNRKILRHIKSNISAQDTAISFSIGKGGQFEWGAFLNCREDRMCNDKNAAKEYIRRALATNPLRWDKLEMKRKEVGVSDSTWRRAKKELGLIRDMEKREWSLP